MFSNILYTPAPWRNLNYAFEVGRNNNLKTMYHKNYSFKAKPL